MLFAAFCFHRADGPSWISDVILFGALQPDGRGLASERADHQSGKGKDSGRQRGGGGHQPDGLHHLGNLQSGEGQRTGDSGFV